MPYKDRQAKREWEVRHHPQRLARRRELRQLEAAWKETHPGALWVKDHGAAFLFFIVAGGALAAYDPTLGMGVGGLTLVVAAAYKKGWSWWIVGAVILALGLFFRWNKNEKK